jgi:carboxylesterase
MRATYGELISSIKKKQAKRHKTHYRGRWVIGGLLVLGLMVLSQPWDIKTLKPRPHPVQSYNGAVQEIEEIRSVESTAFNPEGRLRFMTHHQKVNRVIIFVHGYTNCPQQFATLGEKFFEMGYNVLIAPMPYHGLADRMTDAHGKLTAEDLAGYSDHMVDIAQGLGDRVTMVGLSAGGNVAAWAAQTRADLDAAIIIAPVFGYQNLPLIITPLVTNICRKLPNFFQWWEPKLKEAGGVDHSYPRFASHAVAESLRLGFTVQDRARQKAPAARRIVMVTNASDASVHPVPIIRLAQNWRKHGAAVESYQFEARLHLGHDFIDPAQPYAHTDRVYPKLIKLIAGD